jgi:hypothetical protein
MFVLKSKYEKLENELKLKNQELIQEKQKHCQHENTERINGMTVEFLNGEKVSYNAYTICHDCGKMLKEVKNEQTNNANSN